MSPEERAENFRESDKSAVTDSGDDAFWQARLAEAKIVQDAQRLSFTSMTDIPPIGASKPASNEQFCLVDGDSGAVLASKEVSGGIEPREYRQTLGAAGDAPVEQPEDKQTQTTAETASSNGSAENTGTVIDYQPRKTGDNTYALGMDWQQAPENRPPSEGLTDFLQAAADRANDPAGWQKYLDGQVEKFIGIAEGLNMAKEHTKEAVVAGWTALTDGTIAEFLSKPNAINDPLFKAVGGALDAMAQDPNAVTHAFERLGNAIRQASERYSSLPDRQKGRVIGETAFFMFNPEGSTEAGEAALKIADTVATGVDQAVMDGIRASVKAVDEMAAVTPELADQARRILYDYARKLGLSTQELELAGIPKGYFDGIEPIPGAAKGEDFYAMSKADDLTVNELEGEFKLQTKAGAGGDWPILNERPSPDVVRQATPDGCVAAIGEMLSEGALKQQILIDQVSTVPELLAETLGPDWKGAFFDFVQRERALDALILSGKPWGAELREEFAHRAAMGHMVVVDGLDEAGHLMIRDPQHGTRYEMTRDAFLKHWSDRAVYKKDM
ncbi:MAG TPA: hypothetical protein V6D08_08970 [Candidatus Obscuribacterales bacterium]